MIYLADVWHYALLILGCGFVIFFHELGHFLAAKYSGVKVEQFAVGFGPAVFAWRRGIGFRPSTTTPELEKRTDEYLADKKLSPPGEPPSPRETADAIAALGLGETEYRLNWLPLGGYVKMLGQDDLNPDAASEDPRSFNNKPVRKRMLIISAGVFMNIVLAAIGFMVVYLLGFRTAPAEVGGVMANSPAAFAERADGTRCPLAVGDRLLDYDGKPVRDFINLSMNVALGEEGRSIPIVVRHPDGKVETLYVLPRRPGDDPQDLVSLGVFPPLDLRGPNPDEVVEDESTDRALFPADADAVKPGDQIVAINGSAVGDADGYWQLNQAYADSDGEPIVLTVRNSSGAQRQEKIDPHFQIMFGAVDTNFAGMQPRTAIELILPQSPARGQIHPGDVITEVSNAATHASVLDPPRQALVDALNSAGEQEQSIVLTLQDASGLSRKTAPVQPSYQVTPARHGLGVQLGIDEQSTVVSTVQPDGAAAKAGIQAGWELTEVNHQPVRNWFMERRILAACSAGQSVPIVAQTSAGPKTVQMLLTQADIDTMRYMTFTSDLSASLRQREELRQTNNPILAAEWGVLDTRDQIVQFYLTLRRMFGGSVSYKEAMGPIGIFRAGAAYAGRGPVWLIWFLSMISAQLACLNFLPIPVVDGGLFVFLLIELIQGRQLSLNTQKIVQMVGLALILSVFILVTYQDVLRWLGKA
jgi:regulator of sigma E protease